jgi:PKD repeat protein
MAPFPRKASDAEEWRKNGHPCPDYPAYLEQKKKERFAKEKEAFDRMARVPSPKPEREPVIWQGSRYKKPWNVKPSVKESGQAIKKVRLRNGRIVDFDRNRITNDIFRRVKNQNVAEELSDEAVRVLEQKYAGMIPTTKDVYNVVQRVLADNQKPPIWAPSPIEPPEIEVKKPYYSPPTKKFGRRKRTHRTENLVLIVAIALLVGAFYCIYLNTNSQSTPSSLPSSSLSPTADFGFSSESVQVGNTVQFTDRSVDDYSAILSWTWDFGDGSTSTYQNPTYSYSLSGVYGVKLTVKDNNGKTDTCLKNINILPWSGEDGESLNETVMVNGGILVGGNGHTIKLHNNPDAKNPTWGVLLWFLQRDTTEQIPYVYGSFVCADFAETLHNNAETAGIRAAYVSVELSGIGHACNAFRTTDRGLVFIDDTGQIYGFGYDKQVSIVVGKQYVPTALFSSDVYFLSMGTVDSYEIQW